MNLGNRHSQHSFAQIPNVNMARSKFDRSFPRKSTFNFDQLVPFFVDEILPGDTCNLNVKSFIRLAPQVVPVLDNMYIDYFFFFVPNRLVWDNWERFNGAKDDPDDSTDYLVPQVSINDENEVGTIYDYMAIPTDDDATGFGVCAFPFRGYNLIYNEWFRDQNLQNSLTVPKGDGPDTASTYALKNRAKKHDYFTSCLPWPQKGPSVELSIGGTAPVMYDPDNDVGGSWQYAGLVYPTYLTGQSAPLNMDTNGNGIIRFNTGTGTYPHMAYDPKDSLYADLSAATAATINQFRQAIMTQSILELDARGGTRYVEILRAHFNVISPDFRLQRPEFLSGGSTHINQHPVPQTSATETGSPQGNLAAFSTASTHNVGFTKSFVEHGWVIGLVQARADVSYQQGLNRMWSRRTRWDYFWPKLQELGEQAVLNKEIFLTGSSTDDEPFGYNERYAEYRYRPAEITGQFRSTFSQSLDVWTLAQEFVGLPSLNGDFIESATPIDRILEVPDADYPALLADFWFDYKHARPMMTYGVPATLGRF